MSRYSERWFFYDTLTPIDVWEGGFTHHELMERDGAGGFDGVFYARLMDNALSACRKLKSGWAGDIRDGPFMFFIPAEYTTEPCVVWKQDSNGNTFAVSAVPLPHLEFLMNSRVPVVQQVRVSCQQPNRGHAHCYNRKEMNFKVRR